MPKMKWSDLRPMQLGLLSHRKEAVSWYSWFTVYGASLFLTLF